MDDIKKINVGGFLIGLWKLDQVIADMAREYAGRPDREVGEEMLARLGRDNYIAPSAREEYFAAFVAEFRKALGQPYEAGSGTGLEIRVLGPGCPRCAQLFERVAKVLSELGLGADLEKITDTKEIAASGVLVTPGLMINGRVVATGKAPSEEQIKTWLRAHDNN